MTLNCFPKGRISVSTQIQADWKLDPPAAAFKVCKYIHTVLKPAWPPVSGDVQVCPGGSHKNQSNRLKTPNLQHVNSPLRRYLRSGAGRRGRRQEDSAHRSLPVRPPQQAPRCVKADDRPHTDTLSKGASPMQNRVHLDLSLGWTPGRVSPSA